MNVYISVDMEGVAGIGHEDQTDPFKPTSSADYAVARRLMTEEANAAVAGALAAGANRIVVNDSHWQMCNILPEMLDPAAELITGSPKRFAMVAGIEAGFDALFFVGYHAMAGSAPATIDHTYNDTIQKVRLNGEPVGEIGLNAALAGSYDVGVNLVTGDSAACAEARALLGNGITTVTVKESIGRHAVRSVHPTVARERIRNAAEKALGNKSERWSPGSPTTISVDFTRTVHAEMASLVPSSRRTGPRQVEFSNAAMAEVFLAWQAFYNLARAG